MREGKINVPHTDNDGNSTQDVISAAMLEMVAEFNGCSALDVKGAWKDDAGKLYVETLTQLVSAYEPSEAGDRALREIAVRAGLASKQLAVYVCYASGDVEIVNLVPLAKAA